MPVDMRDAYAFGGGLHCCTADVYREGELKRLFSKTIDYGCRLKQKESVLNLLQIILQVLVLKC